MSDFVTRRELHALDLYQHVYRRLEVEHQIAFHLPGRSSTIAVTVSRDKSDFSDEDLALMEGVRGVMGQVHRVLSERAVLDVLLRTVEDHTGGPLAVFVVEASGSLTPAHPRAEILLSRIGSQQQQLEELERWIRLRRAGRPRDAPARLVLQLEPAAVEVRYLQGAPGQLDALVLKEWSAYAPAGLLALGVTARQAEVLHMLWQGKSNGLIALTLGISQHTVRHHLEAIYRRLGVQSRAAAVHRAGQALAVVPPAEHAAASRTGEGQHSAEI